MSDVTRPDDSAGNTSDVSGSDGTRADGCIDADDVDGVNCAKAYCSA